MVVVNNWLIACFVLHCVRVDNIVLVLEGLIEKVIVHCILTFFRLFSDPWVFLSQRGIGHSKHRFVWFIYKQKDISIKKNRYHSAFKPALEK